MNLFTFIIGLLYAVSETSAQYYYVSAGQPALFQFRSDYNSFPQQQYSTYHGNQQFLNFHGNQQFPNFHGNQQFSNFHGNQQFSTFHGNQQVHRAQVPVAPPAYIPPVTPAPPVQTQHTVVQNDVPEYRGFAYQTTLNNNAVSHVLFVSGPESQKFTSRVFSSMTSPQNVDVEKARNIASDLVDPIKNDEYSSTGEEYILSKKSDNVYSPHSIDFDNPEKSFSNFFHSPGSFASVVNFYSSPKAGLFARPVSGYPADTVPLQTPPTNSVFNLFGSNLETKMTTTTESTIANDDDTVVIDNAEAQESIMTNTRFRLNDLVVPRGKSLELTDEKLIMSTTVSSATEKDTVTEKIESAEDNVLSIEATMKSLELTGTTTDVSELVTETAKSTTMTDVSESSTNIMPTTVTEKAVTTINEPNETTDKSIGTTNESVEILDRSVQTTSQSLLTSDQSASIMGQSEQTTDQSVQTTVQAISITGPSIPTTAQPMPTTELFAQTTEQLAQIMDESTQTRDQPVETTRQFVPTTEQSVQTTGQSIETTNQAEQSTVMAETTAANLGEGTVITEEIGTTTTV
ncbi:hypothetical protein CBL_14181 [Carabus blaptoides fortunei]